MLPAFRSFSAYAKRKQPRLAEAQSNLKNRFHHKGREDYEVKNHIVKLRDLRVLRGVNVIDRMTND
jgi:hypothetical protein